MTAVQYAAKCGEKLIQAKAAWVAMYHGEPERLVTVDESSLGEPDAIHAQANTSETPTRKPFGFSPNSPAPSTAALNRAVFSQPVNQQPVNQQPVNQQPVTALQSVINAPTGSLIHCPHCHAQFTKRNSRHLFCSNNRNKRADGGNCSDEYHNAHDPKRLQYLVKRKRQPKYAVYVFHSPLNY